MTDIGAPAGAAGRFPGGASTSGNRDPASAEAIARVVLRPIATPLSLGFLGLAAATLTASGLELGWISRSQKPFVGLVVVAFTTLVQLVATGYGFLTRDSVAATGMGVLTGTWFAIGLDLLLSPAARATSGALGMLLLGSATALLVPAATALFSKGLAAAVLLGASVRFYATAAYELSGSHTWRAVAGWVGVGLFFLAFSAALAFELEDVRRRPLRVTLRRGRSASALAEGMAGELAGVHQEAGVREQL